jgi:hypothetical protein
MREAATDGHVTLWIPRLREDDKKALWPFSPLIMKRSR